MSSLSISTAWEESLRILKRDGSLITSVALALVVLPMAVFTAVVPGGVISALTQLGQGQLPYGLGLLCLFLVLLIGQLSVARLALGPSVSVGGAIQAALRRAPTYIGAALIFGLIMTVAVFLVSFLAVIAARPTSQEQFSKSPALMISLGIVVCVYLFLFARLLSVSAAVACSEEELGPIGILRRSWRLTAGHLWRIVGFIVVFFIATSIAAAALELGVGSLVQIVLGKIEPFSASAVLMALVDGLVSGAITVVLIVMLARIYTQLAGRGEAQASVPSSGI